MAETKSKSGVRPAYSVCRPALEMKNNDVLANLLAFIAGHMLQRVSVRRKQLAADVESHNQIIHDVRVNGIRCLDRGCRTSATARRALKQGEQQPRQRDRLTRLDSSPGTTIQPRTSSMK